MKKYSSRSVIPCFNFDCGRSPCSAMVPPYVAAHRAERKMRAMPCIQWRCSGRIRCMRDLGLRVGTRRRSVRGPAPWQYRAIPAKRLRCFSPGRLQWHNCLATQSAGGRDHRSPEPGDRPKARAVQCRFRRAETARSWLDGNTGRVVDQCFQFRQRLQDWYLHCALPHIGGGWIRAQTAGELQWNRWPASNYRQAAGVGHSDGNVAVVWVAVAGKEGLRAGVRQQRQ